MCVGAAHTADLPTPDRRIKYLVYQSVGRVSKHFFSSAPSRAKLLPTSQVLALSNSAVESDRVATGAAVMELALRGRDLASQIQAATSQIHSITGLKRLGAHDEVKDFWQKAEVVMAKVDWQSQQDALAGISKLTRSFTALDFAAFYAAIPRLVHQASKAKNHSKTAARSLAVASTGFAALSVEVDVAFQRLANDSEHSKYWQGRDSSGADNFALAGHILGPMTLGLGYLLWLPSNEYKRRADNHAQSLKIIKDVQGLLRDRIGPVFAEASNAMDKAAEFFDELVVQLNEVMHVGDDAAAAKASELHDYYMIMQEVMKELREAVQKLSACLRVEERRIE